MTFTGILIGLLIAIAFAWVWKTYNMNEKASEFFKSIGGGGIKPPKKKK